MQPTIGSVWELPKVEEQTVRLKHVHPLPIGGRNPNELLNCTRKGRPSRRFKVEGFANCGAVMCEELDVVDPIETDDHLVNLQRLKAVSAFWPEDFEGPNQRLTEVPK